MDKIIGPALKYAGEYPDTQSSAYLIIIAVVAVYFIWQLIEIFFLNDKTNNE